MKIPRPYRNRILAYLRFTASSAFFAAAAALAFVASSTNVLTTHDAATTKSRLPLIKPLAQDSITAQSSELSGTDGSFVSAQDWAQEQAKIRAFPADETPFTAQLNSIIGVKRFLAASASNTPATAPKGRVSKKSKKAPPEPPRFNSWTNIGPSTSLDPNVLTFSGGPYTTSGRITAMALDTHNTCTAAFCRLWVGAAGGGVWRTLNATAPTPTWTFLTQINFFTNAIGALTFVDNGTANGILYAGTGEPNASADSEAGLGLFESFDGGDTWQPLNCTVGPITTNSPGTGPNGTYTGNAFFGRAIASIVVDPTNHNVIYVSSDRSVRGIDSTYGGPTSNPPVPRPPFGLFKSLDGGNTFSFIWDGSGSCPAGCNGADPLASIRGVTDVRLDPTNHNIVYAATFPGPGVGGGGVWRSNDAGVTWTQIKTARNPVANLNTDRCAFDVVDLAFFGLPGVTRMYVGCGNSSNSAANAAHVFISDGVQTGVPVFTDLTAAEVPAGQSVSYCTSQCWYDNVVRTFGPLAPYLVYVAGSYNYGECGGNSDCRGVIVSNTSGASWFDFTWDAQDNGMPVGPPFGQCCNPNQAPVVGPAPNQMHPDHHFILPIPNVAFGGGFFDGSDGGMVRASGGISDQSGQCTGVRTADGSVSNVPLCQQLLSGVPVQIFNMNAGLNTLQFMSLSFDPFNQFHVQGGTQDNGTFQTFGSFTWNQEIFGDGGQSGFNSGNPNIHFNTFTGSQNAGNFRNGDPNWWVGISNFIFSAEGGNSLFYPPIIADPTFAGAIFQGSAHVWRTQDNGGTQAFLEANCANFVTLAPFCGDFVALGGVAGVSDQGCLVCGFWGNRAGGAVEAVERTTSNSSVAWATTTAGRVFISTNVNGPAASVIWNRLDPVGAVDPTRVPTGVAINPFNTFQGWVSYSGYNFNTPAQPGHVFRVTWSGAGTATYTNITFNLPDIPYTSIVFDPFTGDLYVSSDFVVFRLANGLNQWDIAGVGMPLVEIPKLTINPNARVLYAATHGLGGWRLPLY